MFDTEQEAKLRNDISDYLSNAFMLYFCVSATRDLLSVSTYHRENPNDTMDRLPRNLWDDIRASTGLFPITPTMALEDNGKDKVFYIRLSVGERSEDLPSYMSDASTYEYSLFEVAEIQKFMLCTVYIDTDYDEEHGVFFSYQGTRVERRSELHGDFHNCGDVMLAATKLNDWLFKETLYFTGNAGDENIDLMARLKVIEKVVHAYITDYKASLTGNMNHKTNVMLVELHSNDYWHYLVDGEMIGEKYV
jgi:hypothetical protein